MRVCLLLSVTMAAAAVAVIVVGLLELARTFLQMVETAIEELS